MAATATWPFERPKKKAMPKRTRLSPRDIQETTSALLDDLVILTPQNPSYSLRYPVRVYISANKNIMRLVSREQVSYGHCSVFTNTDFRTITTILTIE